MRVSTQIIFDQNMKSMSQQQSAFMKVGNQLATGRRVVNISDDPQAASRAVNVQQSKATTQQMLDARVSARNNLSQQESVLNGLGDMITRSKTLLVQASNGAMSELDKASIAAELEGLYEAMIGQANVTDGVGRFLFAGQKDDSAPVVKIDGRAQFVADIVPREQFIDDNRKMTVRDTAERVFAAAPGSTTYHVKVDSANQGTLVVNSTNVLDTTNPQFGEKFTVAFADDGAGGLTYSITTAAGEQATGAFNAGDAIEFGGLRFATSGTPSAGDSFTAGRAAEMDPNLFRTMEDVIQQLRQPLETDEQRAAQRNVLSESMRELDHMLDNILTRRASVGSRLNELDTLDLVGNNRLLAYEQTLSDLVDLDYVKAASDYSMRMIGLQAAQKTFVDIKGMNLFDYLR
ncbi:flagellar hook-associated protein FlgL [Aliidiomarina haloalkalitolerans]|uniref:Flagellar hook-associated protein 3 n=1 Tax=Aliidiomarina haloalkalitolerans TaxID=859059 RepID=A0A432VSB8_9GAMM|nr:flagellar hook-associated protein FlgL [Aliidiomarina haloalkalitolerans]RUO19226.1 flagellar hook-associated protein 3 [Aliidiomarina haloalkalitolerans]